MRPLPEAVARRRKARPLAGESSLNPTRVYLERFAEEAGRSLSSGARVLDAGAGRCQYAPYFQSHRYETADFCQVDKGYGRIDHVCDLAAIPVEDRRYDLVLCSQVLEHVPHPAAVLRELCRVLRPEGRLWLTAPLFYEEHEAPHDYYRYTRYGLQRLLEDAGFEVERLDWLGGYYGTLAHQLELAARSLSSRPRAYGGGWKGRLAALVVVAARPLFALLARFFAALDLRHPYTAHGHAKSYCVVARRPAVPEGDAASPLRQAVPSLSQETPV